jgi:hypothetical protein
MRDNAHKIRRKTWFELVPGAKLLKSRHPPTWMPGAPPEALDLLSKLLTYDPNQPN